MFCFFLFLFLFGGESEVGGESGWFDSEFEIDWDISAEILVVTEVESFKLDRRELYASGVTTGGWYLCALDKSGTNSLAEVERCVIVPAAEASGTSGSSTKWVQVKCYSETGSATRSLYCAVSFRERIWLPAHSVLRPEHV